MQEHWIPIAAIDVAMVDPGLLWQVEHMNLFHQPTGLDRVLHDALVARLCRNSAAPVLVRRAPASAGSPNSKEVATDDGY